jgi:retron-type reverse transcriptase
MWMTANQFFLILFVAITMIYLGYKSRMKLLHVQAFAEYHMNRTTISADKMKTGLEGMVDIRKKYEQFNVEQKENIKIMCYLDVNKECDICHGNCPYRVGGGLR